MVDSEEEQRDEDEEEGQPWNPHRSGGGYDNPPGVEPHSDDSDLDPIPLGGMQHDYGSADEWPEYSDDDDEDEPRHRRRSPQFKARSQGQSRHRSRRRSSLKVDISISLCFTIL